jgi:signal transduction histidine kinase
MGWAQRLMPRSITAQIASLVAFSVLFGIALAVTIILYFFGSISDDDKRRFAAGRVAEIAHLLRAAKTPDEADVVLAMVRRDNLDVTRVVLADLVPRAADDVRPLSSRRVLRQMAAQPGIELLEGLHYPASPSSQIVVKLDEGHVLISNLVIDGSFWPILIRSAAAMVIVVLIFMPLLSVYAVRWLVAPLAEAANAAASFGRSPQPQKALSRRGPREIIQVIDALNEMRIRIHALLDDRTRMLAAISHDLRTPLTRLRLRTERVGQDNLRTAMLDDIAKVTHMINETLEYLRDDARSEVVSRIDLPSFLQTVCTDFTDTGHTVTYAGPARLSYPCRPRALARAITNVVENAVKHGSIVTVALGAESADSIEIEVADDGPGIPAALRHKVFEPFFKADNARRQSNSGFGLGLSIAHDIVKRHGGSIEMKSREPSGLRVLMLLPPKHLLT